MTKITQRNTNNSLPANNYLRDIGIIALIVTAIHGAVFLMWALAMQPVKTPLGEQSLAMVAAALFLTAAFAFIQDRRKLHL